MFFLFSRARISQWCLYRRSDRGPGLRHEWVPFESQDQILDLILSKQPAALCNQCVNALRSHWIYTESDASIPPDEDASGAHFFKKVHGEAVSVSNVVAVMEASTFLRVLLDCYHDLRQQIQPSVQEPAVGMAHFRTSSVHPVDLSAQF